MISEPTARHRAEELRRLLALIDKSVPAGLGMHVIVDNSSTHKTPAIQRWLLSHPRFSFHFTHIYSFRLKLGERWFAELTERWLRCDSQRSTKELVASIRSWICDWNEDPRPFVWHKSADEILETLAAYCQRLTIPFRPVPRVAFSVATGIGGGHGATPEDADRVHGALPH